MGHERTVYLPPQFAVDLQIEGNSIRQLRRSAFHGPATVVDFGRGKWDLVIRTEGSTLIAPRPVAPPSTVDEVLVIPYGGAPIDLRDLNKRKGRARWSNPAPDDVTTATSLEWEIRRSAIRNSWSGRFFFLEEQRREDGSLSPGLRPPQIGALYGILSHWKVTTDPATVVMPTGTGKTETMLSLLAYERPVCLLVVVPTVALREQIANKFLTFGVLKRFGVIAADALYPLVGTLKHMPSSAADVKAFFGCCNVVVTTMSIAGGATDEIQQVMAEEASHLFIDEAHHVRAQTWETLRDTFKAEQRPIIQFTATPFRNDGKHVDGKLAFSYPLRKAQAEGYFKRIGLRSVFEFDKDAVDEAIAAQALAQLNADLAAGYDHLIMARAETIGRAEAVHAVYQRLAPDKRPLLIHSQLTSVEQRNALEALWSRDGRVVVCVGMLGEGFDLPELKIAALHDPHRSLAITLQFTGRFTRGRDDLGDATVVTNIADPKVERTLRMLYAEDADWNVILQDLSEGALGRQAEVASFLAGFGGTVPHIPLQNIFPKMSTVVYRTQCADWDPLGAHRAFAPDAVLMTPAVNAHLGVVLVVTQERLPVPWGMVRELQDLVHHLYLAHWDPKQNLLFIHSSNNEGFHGLLARELAGDDVELVEDQFVFRCMDGLHQLILMNIGLSHSIGGAVRFSMHMGSDVGEGLADAMIEGRIRTNVFGRGYENGVRASVGCSRRGRIWSHAIAPDVPAWVDWCHRMGEKILDDTITVEGILRRAMVPRKIMERPNAVPITIEWPEEFFMRDEDGVEIDVKGERRPFYEVDLELSNHDIAGPLRFSVCTDEQVIEYEVQFVDGAVVYAQQGHGDVSVVLRRRAASLGQWFNTEPPLIRFSDGSFLVKDKLYEPKIAHRNVFDANRIEAWDWSGVAIKKESQIPRGGGPKRKDSIQYRVIERLMDSGYSTQYDFVIDDDSAGEAADIVALAATDSRLTVHLFHCKFSKDEKAGARVDDLYAVCGQAQRSVHWRGLVERLFKHLVRREVRRLKAGGPSRIEKGDWKALQVLSHKAPLLKPEFKIFIVQPGLSVGAATKSELELLGATELHLKETYRIPLGVIASA